MGMDWSAADSTLKWNERIDIDTFVNAFHTYRTVVDEKETMEEFAIKLTRRATYMYVTIRDLVDTKRIVNLGRHRLEADTAEEAYPPHDRPRGYEQDVQRVVDLTQSTSPISPVVIIADPQDKTDVFLDGMHRLVAAKLKAGTLDTLVRVCFATASQSLHSDS